MADTTAYKLSGTAVAKLANMWRASQRDGVVPSRGAAPRSRADDQWCFGKVTSGGPGTYQISRQFLQSGDPATFVDAGGDYEQTFTATNLSDMNASEPTINTGDYVIVRWEYDGDGKPRYIISQVSAAPQWQTVVTGFGDNGSAITYDTIEILVFKTRNPNTGQILIPYGDCTGS